MHNHTTIATFKHSSIVQICLSRKTCSLVNYSSHTYLWNFITHGKVPFLDFCFPMQDLSGDYNTYTSNANLLIIAYTLWPTMCLWICLIHLSTTSNYHSEYMLTSFNHILTYIYLWTIIRVPDLIYHPNHGFLSEISIYFNGVELQIYHPFK